MLTLQVNKPVDITLRIAVDGTTPARLLESLEQTLVRAITKAYPKPAVSPSPPPEPTTKLDADVETGDSDEGPMLLDMKQVAEMLNVSERTVWSYSNCGAMLRPIKFGGGRAVRWPANELKQWVKAGCPTHEQWQKMRRSRPHGR